MLGEGYVSVTQLLTYRPSQRRFDAPVNDNGIALDKHARGTIGVQKEMQAVATFFLVGLCISIEITYVTEICAIIPTRGSIVVACLLVQRAAELGLTGLVIRIIVPSSTIFCERKGPRQVGVDTCDKTEGNGPADLTPLADGDAVLEIPGWV